MNTNENLYPYVDGIGSMRMVDGVVRMDLVVITEIDGQQMKAQRVSGLAMSLPAAIKLKDQLDSMVEELKTKGVLQQAEKKQIDQ
jgi:hypothetical protein